MTKRTQIENQTASKIDIRTSKATRIDPDRLLEVGEMATIIDNILAEASDDYAEHQPHLLDEDRLAQIRRQSGRRATRPLHQDGIKYNATTYTSASLWLGGLGKGDMVDIYEDMDDSSRIFVFRDGEYVCDALDRELGVVAMSLEEHKAAKKADIANRIVPMRAIVAKGERVLAEYQDAKTSQYLGYTPVYATPKAKPKSVKQINKAIDGALDIMRAAGY